MKINNRGISLPTLSQNFSAILYNRLYSKTTAFSGNSEDIHPSNLQIDNRSTGNLKTKIRPRSGGISQSISSSNCQEWGAFLVSRDEMGNIVSEELLYTYWVGDCGSNITEDQVAPGFGGGSIETAQLIYVVPPSEPIPDINEYLKCFTQQNGSLYSVTIAAQQPIPGSSSPYVNEI